MRTQLPAPVTSEFARPKPAIRNDGIGMDAERIRQIRQKMQLTQEDFAHLIGVTFSTVNRWENGKSSPNRIASRLLLGLEKKLKQQ